VGVSNNIDNIGDIGVLAIKMPLGMEVALGPNDIVLDGDPAHFHQKRGTAPSFWPCLLWPNGWMDQDITWYGGSLGTRGEQRAPPMFGRATITLGIGPHF